MSNLSRRVQKSKSLKFNSIPGITKSIGYGTTSHNHEHHYQVFLSKTRDASPFGDKSIMHDTISVRCIRCASAIADCKGNSNGTVCYHGLGAIRKHLERNGSSIAFCQDIFDAVKLRKPGQTLIKVVSAQGGAVLWGVVERKPQSFEKRVELMRGSRAEGID